MRRATASRSVMSTGSRVVQVERHDVDAARGEVRGEVAADEAARAGDDGLHELASRGRVVEVEELVDGVVPGERAVAGAAACDEDAADAVVGEHGGERGGEGVDVVGATSSGGVADDLGDAHRRRGDHRDAGGHRLERREAEALVERRVREDRRRPRAGRARSVADT